MLKTEPPYISSCPIGCRSDLVVSDIVLPEGPLRRCSVCGQLVLRIDETIYKNSMKVFDDPKGTCQSGIISRRLLKRTKKTLKTAKVLLGKDYHDIRLLDVGCSIGSFITIANNLGVYAEGVEPMPKPAMTAVKSGLKVHQGFLEDLPLPEQSFDIVTLIEVIEHLQDPVSLLQACHRVIRPDGLMIIRTGNTDSWTVRFMKDRWDYFCPAIGHISFFNTDSMRILADRTKFTIEKIRFHSVSFSRKEDVPVIQYRVAKFFSELLNFPSKLFGKSHEIEVFLRAKNI